MSQQHMRFEEEFRDNPPPVTPYQTGYTSPQPTVAHQPNSFNPPPLTYTVNVPPSQSYINMPGQKLLVHDMNAHGAPGVGARLALSILSVVFTFVMFVVALGVAVSSRFDPFPTTPVSIFFALLFAAVVVIINVVFNRSRS